MRYRSTGYLKLNRFGLFYFRRVIPPDLRGFFAFKEVARSLRTGSPKEAASLARRYGASLDLLFDELRDMAKGKGSNVFQQELIVELEFDENGVLRKSKAQKEPHDSEAFAERMTSSLVSVARGVAPQQAKRASPPLFEQIELYLDEMSRGGHWRNQTAIDAKGDFEQFKQILGDMPVADLCHEALNKLRDTLLKLPANINKLPATRGKTVAEILALGLLPQSPLTVKKKWDRVSAFLAWLEGKGLVEKNYAKGKKPKAKAQSYEKFTSEDLRRIFESEEYQSGFAAPFQYWLPLLGLYTGARLEELSQLHLADIRQDAETQIWTIDITEEVDEKSGADTEKKLKTASSARKCPVHSKLIAAGLLRYVEALKTRGHDRLFPELRPDKLGKVSGRASEWFTEYRRSKGVGELTGKSRKNFHSFRHTMNAALQRAEVPQEFREALCGHAPKAINVRVYGGGHPIEHLHRAIEKLDYEVTIYPFKVLSGVTAI